MKKIVQLVLGLMLTGTFSSALAGSMGYVWILSGGYYDRINYSSQFKYLLGSEMKKMPNVNSIIRIEAKNRIYADFNKIQDITQTFKRDIDDETCADGIGAFTAFMLGLNKGCSVDSVAIRHKDVYVDLSQPIKAKVLGYVEFNAGRFILIEQLEVINDNLKDK